MKKLLILGMILSALATGCGAKEAAEVRETGGKSHAAGDSGGAVKKPVKEPEGDAPWIQAYYDAADGQMDKLERILLTDIDGDGVPELFLQWKASWDARDFYIHQAYSYKDGALSQLSLPKDAGWTGLGLYTDRESGRSVCIADRTYSTQEGRYEYSKVEVDFSDPADIKQTVLLEWAETRVKDASGKSETHYYKMPDNVEMTWEQQREAERELMDQYQSQNELSIASGISYVTDYNPDTHKHNLNKDLFYALIRMYDEKQWENYKYGEDPDYMRVDSVRSDLLVLQGGGEGRPVSVVSEGAKLRRNGKLCIIWLDQINLHPDQEIMKSLNEKLKSRVLSSLAKSNFSGSFQANQDSFSYKNYLAVSQKIRYTEQGSKDRKEYYTAETYNLETGENAKLSELAGFDGSMKDRLYAGEFENERFTHEECLEQGIYDKLWSLMSNPDLEDHFYIGEVECGFIIDLAAEDNFCFSFSARELADYLH